MKREYFASNSESQRNAIRLKSLAADVERAENKISQAVPMAQNDTL
jgi:hypothetical protein